MNYLRNDDFSQIFISDSLYERLDKINRIDKEVKIIKINNGIINE